MKRPSSPCCLLSVLFVIVSATGVAQVQFDTLGKQRLPLLNDLTRAVALADVDGDGDLDLVLGNDLGEQNRLYVNDGTGTFADATATQMPFDSDSTRAVALADVDGDGDLDMVFANSTEVPPQDGRNRLYFNDGTGTFTDATAAHLPSFPDPTPSVALGDVDGDGDIDIIFGYGGGSRNRLYVNDGTGTFADETAARMPVDRNIISLCLALSDVDRDGDLDLILGNWQINHLYLNDGAGTFWDDRSGRMPRHGDTTTAMAVGDVDGDGDPDLVFGAFGKDRLYLNDGFGRFSGAVGSLPPNSDWTTGMAMGDVDGDGDLDLVLANEWNGSTRQNRLYLNNGTGTFIDATARLQTDTDFTMAVAMGDVDGDDDLDVVFGNGRRDQVVLQNHLYVNLHRQLDTPSPPFVSRAFTIDFYAKPGYAAAPHLAVSALNLALAPKPLPVIPFGNLYLEPNGLINLPWTSVNPATGKGAVVIRVPADPSLQGLTVYVQGLVLDLADFSASHLTSFTADVILK